MSVSTATKIGGSVLISGGSLPASYLTYDSFFSLYKAESDVLKDSVILEVSAHTPTPTDNDSKTTYLKIHKNSSWECIIKAVSTEETPSTKDSQGDLVNLIKEKLPKTDDVSDEIKKEEKQWNKKNLVKNCSKNRKSSEIQSNDRVISEITVALKKNSSGEKWTFEDENLGKLFGKGFWI